MSQTGPWSVKGIDQRARDAAREAAMAEGITLGEYLSRLLMAAEDTEYNEVRNPYYEGPAYSGSSYRAAPRQPRPDPRHDSRYDPRPDPAQVLERLSRRIEATEARSTLAITGIDHTVLGLVARLENTEQTSAAIAGHVEGVIEQLRETHEALQAKVRRLEQDETGKDNLETLKALEAALGKLATHVYEEAELAQGETAAITGRIESGFLDITDRFETLETRVERKLSDAAARASQAVEQAAARAEHLTAPLTERLSAMEAKLAEKRADETETVSRLALLEGDVSGAIHSMEATLLRVQDRLNRAETTTDAALRGLESTFAHLDQRIDAVASSIEPDLAERLRSEFEARFEDMTHLIRSAVDNTRLELAQEISRTAEHDSETVTRLKDELGELKSRLSDVEARDPEEMTAGVRAEISQLSETVTQRIEALADQVETRFEESEINTAGAIEQVGEQVTVAAVRLQKRQDEALAALAEEISIGRKDMDARLSDALASVSERLDDIHTQSDSALSPVQRAIAALASRLENLEAFNAPPGQPLPPPISTEPDPAPPRAAAPPVSRIADEFGDEEDFESAGSDGSGMFDLLDRNDLDLNAKDRQPSAQDRPRHASDNFESGLVDWDETGDALADVSPYTADFEAIHAAAARIGGARTEPGSAQTDDAMFDPRLPDFEEAEDDIYDPLSELAGFEDAGSEVRESDIFDDEDQDDASDPLIARTPDDGAPDDLIDIMESIDSEHPPKLDDTTSDYLARARRAALAASEAGGKGRSARPPGQKRGLGKTPLYLAASAMVLTGAGAGGYLYLRGKQAPEPAISAPLDTYVDPQLAAAPPAADEAAGAATEQGEPFADFAANTAPAASEEDLFDAQPADVADDTVLTSAARPAELEAMGGPVAQIAALTPVRYLQIPPVVTVETEANAGNGIAQYQLAARYRAEGRLEEAIPLLRRSALKGIAPAQYELGKHFERGEGVDLDFIQARNLIGQAAEAGHVGAMYDYALFLSEGEGGPKAEAEAVSWFRRAAEYGLVDAQYNLGVVHAEGMGTPLDLPEALYWFELARRAGDAAADLEVRNLSSRLPEDTVIGVVEEADAWSAASPAGLANGRFGAQSWNTGNPLQVRGVQGALDALGFDPGGADGVLGQRTADAIRDYQRAEGLSVTGTVTPELIERLNTGATNRRG